MDRDYSEYGNGQKGGSPYSGYHRKHHGERSQSPEMYHPAHCSPAPSRRKRMREKAKHNYDYYGNNWDSPALSWRSGSPYGGDRHPRGYFTHISTLMPPPSDDVPNGDDPNSPKMEKDGDSDNEKSVRSVLVGFADTASIAGISYIKNSQSWINMFAWTFFFMGAMAFLLWQMVFIFTRYYSYPVNTVVDLQQKPLDFPSVTICNINAIRAEKLALNDKLNEFVQNVQGQNPVYSGDYYNEDYNYYGSDNVYYGGYDSEDYFGGVLDGSVKTKNQFKRLIGNLTRAERLEMGHQKEISLLNCIFNGKVCHPENFTTWLSKDYGNCFTFNSNSQRNGSIRTRFGGSEHGLEVQLFKDNAQYISGMTQGGGFRVAIHPYGTLPFPLENGISVAPGRKTFVGLQFRNISRPGKPYGECERDEEFLKHFNAHYTKKSCENTCADRQISRICKCYLQEDIENYPIHDIENLQPCMSEKDIKCTGNVVSKTAAGQLDCDCPKACNEQIFTKEVTENIWPDYGLWNDLVKKLCEVDENSLSCIAYKAFNSESEATKDWFLRLDFLALNVYYSDLTFEQITEVPSYPLANFASDIGGTVGLWLGLSVFSVIEILNLFVQIFKIMCSKKKEKPKGNSKNPQTSTSLQENI